eukprot:g3111.t1
MDSSSLGSGETFLRKENEVSGGVPDLICGMKHINIEHSNSSGSSSSSTLTNKIATPENRQKIYECEFECGFESPARQVVEEHECSCCKSGVHESTPSFFKSTASLLESKSSRKEETKQCVISNEVTELTTPNAHNRTDGVSVGVTTRSSQKRAAAAQKRAVAPSNAIREILKVEKTTETGAKDTMIVYPKECLGHCTGEYHQEHPKRLKILCDESKGVLRSSAMKEKGLRWMETSKAAILSDVLRVHDHSYIEHLKSTCRRTSNAKSLKFDADTVLSSGTLQAAFMAAGAVVTAVDAVATGASRNVFCAVRPPGHHSGPRGSVAAPNFGERPDMCSCGFCLLNNVAIGAAYARNQYGRVNPFEVDRKTAILRRIAIVDFDVHHGNGTEQIIREMRPHEYKLPLPSSWAPVRRRSCRPWLDDKDAEEVWFGSVHLVRDDFYPCSGPDPLDSAIKKEEKEEERNIVNVALPMVGPGDVRVRNRLTPTKRVKFQQAASKVFRKRVSERLLPKLRRFRPDIIFISAGFDAHHSDFYYFLTTDDYRWITQELCEVAKDFSQGRVVSVLEGGYQTTAPLPPRRGGRGRKGKGGGDADKDFDDAVAPLAECVAAHLYYFVQHDTTTIVLRVRIVKNEFGNKLVLHKVHSATYDMHNGFGLYNMSSRIIPVDDKVATVGSHDRVKSSLGMMYEGTFSSIMNQDSERAEDSTMCSTNFMFEPSNKYKIWCWDTLVASMILYTVFMGPYEAAFLSESRSYSSTMLALYIFMSYFSDCTFIVDMLITFRTKIIIKINNIDFLVKDTKTIMYHYFTGSFAIDLVSIGVPFNLGNSILSNSISDTKELQIWIRALNMLNLVKVLRAHRLNMLLIRILRIKPTNMKWFRFIQLLSSLLLTGHTMACVFIIIGTDVSGYPYRDGWIPQHLSSVAISNHHEVYTTAVYYSFATLTTVGFGDVSPSCVEEKLFAIAFMIGGAVMCAVIMGSVVAILDSAGADQERELTENLLRVSKWADVAKLTKRNTSVAIRSVKFQHDIKDIENKNLRSLSAVTQRTCRTAAYGKILRSCYEFVGLENSALRELAQGLEMQVGVCGMNVVEANDIGHFAFIIQKGVCGVMGPGDTTVIRTMSRGETFGLIPALVEGSRVSNTVICLVDCVFYTLSAEFFKSLRAHSLCDLNPLVEVALETDLQRNLNLSARHIQRSHSQNSNNSSDTMTTPKRDNFIQNFEKPLATLIITVRSAKHLAPVDFDGVSDPYCEVTVGSVAKFKTHTIFDTLNPLWNEIFVVSKIDEDLLRDQTITFEVVDHDTIGNDTRIGNVTIECDDLFKGPQIVRGWFPLQAPSEDVQNVFQKQYQRDFSPTNNGRPHGGSIVSKMSQTIMNSFSERKRSIISKSKVSGMLEIRFVVRSSQRRKDIHEKAHKRMRKGIKQVAKLLQKSKSSRSKALSETLMANEEACEEKGNVSLHGM